MCPWKTLGNGSYFIRNQDRNANAAYYRKCIPVVLIQDCPVCKKGVTKCV